MFYSTDWLVFEIMQKRRRVSASAGELEVVRKSVVRCKRAGAGGRVGPQVNGNCQKCGLLLGMSRSDKGVGGDKGTRKRQRNSMCARGNKEV